jgi:multicomponent Na+:H+ antiporter subunit D
VFTFVFRIESDTWFSPLILGIAGATMIVGVLGALSRWTIRNILSFHIISQIGYMIFGLGLLSPLGLASGIFYILHHILVKSTLFLIGGQILLRTGVDDLRTLGGLARSQPLLSALFLAAAFSLAGVPPLSGFYGKFGLVIEGLAQGHVVYVILSILTSLLTLASMLKIWTYVFWGTPPDSVENHSGSNATLVPIVCMTILSLAVALASGPLMALAEDTGRQLLDGTDYIRAVLGEGAVERFAELESRKGS